MMKGFGIIADDLTGSMDTGVQFSKIGLRTIFYLDPASVGDAEVLVLDTESREAPKKVAYERVRDAARRLEGRVIYKKIDSTLRGNIGYELDGVMDELGLKKALIAPAFPGNGRITFEGRQLVGGVPLCESSFAKDPRCPTTNHIPILLKGQSTRSVEYVASDIVDQGAMALKKEIERRQAELLVIDASNEIHLLYIARVAAHLGISCLICGSAGLAQALPSAFGLETHERPTPKYHPGAWPVLVVAGSRHQATTRQIDRATAHERTALIQIDPCDIQVAKEQALVEARKALSSGENVIITTALGPYLAEIDQATAVCLGSLAADIARHSSLSGLVLTGGSIAFSTCRELGVVSIQVCEEVAPGIPAGVILEGDQTGMRLVTKAGGFGEEDALLKAINHLRGIEH